jgi:hypothetical protein
MLAADDRELGVLQAECVLRIASDTSTDLAGYLLIALIGIAARRHLRKDNTETKVVFSICEDDPSWTSLD